MVWKSEINFQRAIKVEAAVKSEVNLIALVGISKCVLNIILMFFFKSFFKWTGSSDEEESTSESELWKGPLPETDEKSQ